MNGIVSGKTDSGVKKFNVLNEISVNNYISQYSFIGTKTFSPPIFGTAYSGNGAEIYVELTGQGNKDTPLYIPLFCAYTNRGTSPIPSTETITLALYSENPSDNSRYDVNTDLFRYTYDYKNGYVFLARIQYQQTLTEVLSRIRIGTFSYPPSHCS